MLRDFLSVLAASACAVLLVAICVGVLAALWLG
jgi:hypothetical protein